MHTSGTVTVYGTLNISSTAAGHNRQMGNLIIKNGGVLNITAGTYTVTGTITVESGGTLNVNGGTLITSQSSGNSLLVYGIINIGAGRLERKTKMIIYNGGLIKLTAGTGYLAFSGFGSNYSQIDGTFDCQNFLTNTNRSNYSLGYVSVASNTTTGHIRTQTAYTPGGYYSDISAVNNFFGFNDNYGGTVEYYGSTAITLDGSNSRFYYYDLEVNTTGHLKLGYSVCTNLTGNLYLKTGNLNLNAKQINIHGTIIYSAGKYFDASIAGGKVHIAGKTSSIASPCSNYFTSITTGIPVAGGTSIYSQGSTVDIKNPELRFSAAGGGSASISELKIFRSDIVILKDNLTITDLLSIKVGILKTLTNTVFLNNSGTTALESWTVGYSAPSTVGWISGNLKRRCATGYAYDFPVGRTDVSVHSADYLKYRNIKIQLNSVAPSPCFITVNFNTTFIPDVCNSTLSNASENSVSYTQLHPEGWWSVIPDAGITAVSYDAMGYIHGFSSPVLIDDQFGLLKRQDGSILCSDWSTAGGTLNPPGSSGRIHEYSGSVEIGYAQRNGFTSFSEIAIGTTNEPIGLPVELISFSSLCTNNEVKINWSTATETNNHGFTVEKSMDAETWTEIGFVKGAGNSNAMINYSLTDNDVSGLNAYYRIKQTDLDGANKYYGIITSDCSENINDFAINIFPNPANDKIYIQSNSESPGKISVLDITGKILSEYSVENLSQTSEINLQCLREGIYFISVESEGLHSYRKIFKY
jgi:hypothetical protein